MCQSEDKVSTTLGQVVSPPTALKGDSHAYINAARCIIVDVPIVTDNNIRSKVGGITPEQGSFPTVRTMGVRSRLQCCSLHTVAVPIGTNRTKMGSITTERGNFPLVRTIGGRSRLL